MKIFLLLLILALLPGTASAQQKSALDSVLLPASNLELYNKPINSLTSSEYWRINMHGLRNAALHQAVWAARKTDRTEGHRVVPIKHFFLRTSEQANYTVKNITLDFAFNKVSDKVVLSKPEKTASVFEIEFGGEFQKGPPGDMANIDRGYVVRLSAFPPLDSGIYYRSHQKYILLKSFEPKLLKTGKYYKVELAFFDNKLSIAINGAAATQFMVNSSDKPLNHGLISMISGWNPLKMKHLEISGVIKDSGKEVPITESGLAKLPAKEPKNAPSKAGNDQIKALDRALERPQQEIETNGR